jgi:hypothetical protein
MTDNFVGKRGLDRLQQFEIDLNKGLSIEEIASSLLHCSERRAYILRNALFQQVWVLRDSARECVENHVKSEQAKIERAIKYSHGSIENRKLRFVLCKQSQESEKA